MSLTPELLADLRKKAEAAAHEDGETWALVRSVDGPERIMSGVVPVSSVYQCSMEAAEHMAAADPATVLALLDRIEALENGLLEMGAIKLREAVKQHAPRLQDDMP